MMFSNTRFPLTAGNQRLSEISLLTHTSPSSSRTQSEGQLVPDYAYPELLPPVVAESQKFFGEITWNPRCRKDQRKSTTYHQYQLPKLPATSMRDTEIVILPAAIYAFREREYTILAPRSLITRTIFFLGYGFTVRATGDNTVMRTRGEDNRYPPQFRLFAALQ